MSSDSAPRPPLPRRRFLQLSATAPAALAARALLPGGLAAAARAADAPAAPPTAAAKKRQIGIELYGVRDELKKDLPNTLRTVAKIGYEVVEFYSPYYGWTYPFAKDVRTQLDDLGLRCFSTHNGFESLLPGETMAKAIELNQILGARHIIMGSAPRTTHSADDWKRLCEHLTTAVGPPLSPAPVPVLAVSRCGGRKSKLLAVQSAPPGDFLPCDFQLLRDLIVSPPARRQEHHKTPLAQTLGSESALDRLGQPVAVLFAQMHGRSNSHGA